CQLLFFTILADCYLYTLSLHDALPILDWAFNLYYSISLFFFVLVVGLIVLFLLKYQRRHEDQKATGQMIHNTLLETSWTVIPLLIVMALFFIGMRGWWHMRIAPANAMTV